MIAVWVAVFALVQATDAPSPRVRTDAVILHDEFAACEVEPYVHDFEWIPAGDSYECGTKSVPRSRIDELRRIVLASRQDPQDVAATLGVTPASVEDHRAEILGHFQGMTVRDFQGKHPLVVPEDVGSILRFDIVSQELLDKIRYFLKSSSTTFHEIRVTLPGETPVEITSEGDMGWLLPWQIETPDRTWRSSNIEISRAVLPLLDADSPNRYILDGTEYWSDWFWTDSFIWWDLYDQLPSIRIAGRYDTMIGYPDIAPRFRVESSRPGESGKWFGVLMDLTALSDGPIQRALWLNPMQDGALLSNWYDFLVAWDESVEAVRWHDWIEAWRVSGTNHRVRLLSVGRKASFGDDLNANVSIAWKNAGFHGEPTVEIELQRASRTAATVFLSCDEPGALIVSAIPGPGDHWLDRMDIAFHPHTPTYVRVDFAGKPEIRSMPPFSDPSESGSRGCRPRAAK